MEEATRAHEAYVQHGSRRARIANPATSQACAEAIKLLPEKDVFEAILMVKNRTTSSLFTMLNVSGR